VVSFPQVSPPNPVCASLLTHTRCMPHSSHSSRFYHPTILGEVYRSLNSSLYSFLNSLVISSLLGPNILFNTLFSNTLSLCSSLNVSDQVWHPYKTRDNIIVIFIVKPKKNMELLFLDQTSPACHNT